MLGMAPGASGTGAKNLKFPLPELQNAQFPALVDTVNALLSKSPNNLFYFYLNLLKKNFFWESIFFYLFKSLD